MEVYYMKKGFPEHLMKIEWTASYTNGYELEKVALFNETVVSEVEVRSWIEQGLLDVERKPTVVVITKKQYENLFDRVTANVEKPVQEEKEMKLSTSLRELKK
jgi:hypothetical protein